MTVGASYIYPALGRAANEGESRTEDGRNGREDGGNIGKGKGKCSGGVGWVGGGGQGTGMEKVGRMGV